MGPQTNLIQAIADQVVRDVAELPDRTSFADWPEAMVVTGEELHLIVVRTIEELSALPPGSIDALDHIIAERRRQIEVEGWTAEHDDGYARDDLAQAAAAYAISDDRLWPWKREWWKPRNRRYNLVRAGALIVAEIERLDRGDERAREEARPGDEHIRLRNEGVHVSNCSFTDSTPLQPVPCSHCGRIPVVTTTATQFLIGHDPNDGAAVTCPFHPVVLPSWGEHPDDAVRAWNRVMGRVTPAGAVQ